MMKKSTSEIVEQFLLYVMVFFILREWLVPIIELTDTGYFSLFMIFIGICLMLGLFGMPFYVNWIIKIFYIIWVSVYVHKDELLTTREFLSQELHYNIDIILGGDWQFVSDPMRTSLFFILIWMLIYLIQHWVMVRHTIYYFLVLTVFFIGTLDTFTDYDGTLAIIKVMVLGLILTALLFIKKLMLASNMQKDWRSYVKFVMPVIVFVIFAGILATLLPKSEPIWPDPVPYVKGWAGVGGSGTSVSTVGYGENDEELGGPFMGDDTPVYEIEAPIRQYWRVETKDTYTSKGWISSGMPSDVMQLDPTIDIPYSVSPGDTEQKQIVVNAKTEYPFLVQAYGTKRFELEDSFSYIEFHAYTEKTIVRDAANDQMVQQNYRIAYQEPKYSYSQLKSVNTSTEALAQYTSLPIELPDRVRDLAIEITSSYDSVYDKARAIVDYFKRSGFQYETQNVKVPAADQDYVDQFLFETKLGYCDNFSTSMVVMLRSIGIQSRWVKGFSTGERIASSEDTVTYLVTNNDAHSWVEVYIDTIGWVPFEPTIGFSNPVNIEYDLEQTDLDEEQLLEQEKPEPKKPEEKEKEKPTSSKSKNVFDFSKYKWVLYVLAGLLVIGGIVAWNKRRQWQPKLVVQMNRSKMNQVETFEEGYFVLLKQLEKIYLIRSHDETLKQFAKRVDAKLETAKMSELTAIYEAYIYSGRSQNYDMTEVKEIWEYLINRTTS
jgi:transglutaminase-like putative cysteine protease